MNCELHARYTIDQTQPHKLPSCRCKILLPTAAPSDPLAFAAADCVSVSRVWYLVCKSTIRTPHSSPGQYVLSTQQHAYSDTSLANDRHIFTTMIRIWWQLAHVYGIFQESCKEEMHTYSLLLITMMNPYLVTKLSTSPHHGPRLD